jgi:glycosyltransferase involved in cell wall biosynthesis
MPRTSRITEKKPVVSVIIPCFNALQYLQRSIPLILLQQKINYEVIVVDNGSTDTSLSYLRSIRDSRLTILSSPISGSKNFACNYAVNIARGEFLLLLDADVIISDFHLLNLLMKRYYSQNNLVKVGLLSLSTYDTNSQVSSSYGYQLGFYFIKEKKKISRSSISKYDGSLTAFPNGQGFFIKKATWDKVGGFEEHLSYGGDDTDLGIRLWLSGYKNFLYAPISFEHIGAAERTNNTKFEAKWELIFYAHMFTIIKNYKTQNLILAVVGYSLFGMVKSIKQAIYRSHLGPVRAYIRAWGKIISNLRIALEKRKAVQSSRIVQDDIFLKVALTKNNV